MLKGKPFLLPPLPFFTAAAPVTDKSAGGRVSQHFEEAAQKLQEYTECLVIEVNERINILDMLKECKIFTTYRMAELQRIITVREHNR